IGEGLTTALRWTRLLRLVPWWIPGKQRVARVLVRPGRQAGEFVIGLRSGLRFRVPSLREPIAFHLLVDGVYEPRVAALLDVTLEPDGVLVDVGANVGCFTVPLAHRLEPAGRVLAVEASPRVLPYLEWNIRVNACRNVWLARAAAHERDHDIVEFYEAPPEKFGMGSVGPQFDEKPVAVPTRTLDSLAAEHRLSRVDAIKLDVEGLEASVLRGAVQLLRDFRPLVVFEFCDWAERRVPGGRVGDAQTLLLDLGYQIWDIESLRRGRAPQPTARTAGTWTLVARHGRQRRRPRGWG
ncbi:MAG TPA: FkbM family methyltransferase, partial [Actinomycetota bacterium]|nr:FkbM family methyltransferase [Actinomycetota bacterium]